MERTLHAYAVLQMVDNLQLQAQRSVSPVIADKNAMWSVGISVSIYMY